MFSYLSEWEIIISATFILSSANTSNLDQSKILPFGKGLKKFVFYSEENIPEIFLQAFFLKLVKSVIKI